MERTASLLYAIGAILGVLGLAISWLIDGSLSHAVAVTLMIASTIMLFAGVYVFTIDDNVNPLKKIARGAYFVCFLAFFLGQYHEVLHSWPLPEAIMLLSLTGLFFDLVNRHNDGDPPGT